MKKTTIGSKTCLLHGSDTPDVVLIQLTARHEDKSIGEELQLLDSGMRRPCLFVGVSLDEWARCLMPWPDEAVSRDGDVGLHAGDTLLYITHTLLPWLHERYGTVPCVLGGYSLGGLFALWAAYQTDVFEGIAAVSPSVWIRGWMPFAASHTMHARAVYMSLGDREEHARNQRMAAVGTCIRHQHTLLTAQLGEHAAVMQWNKGGHFDNEAARMAHGLVWAACAATG